jgi:hypothetical protein
MLSNEKSYMFKAKKDKKNLKIYVQFIICFLILILGLNIYINNQDDNEEIVTQENYLEQIPSYIKDSDDEVIQILLDKANDNEVVANILIDTDLYPYDLLELASKKDEVIEFVANFPDYIETTDDISIEEEYIKGEIPHFIQWDERWGYSKYGEDYFAVNGCGPTSLAMVIVGLTGDTTVNPRVICEYSEENGYIVDGVGTSWQLMKDGAKAFGLEAKELPLDENVIINTLKEGNPIIMSMGPGTFTTMGHYIVLTGVDSEGKIIVNDSDSKIRSDKTWDVDVFINEAKNLWTFKAI